MATPRMRTLDQCAAELRAIDPESALSKNAIRSLALSGAIPLVRIGNKRLINFDRLCDYLADPPETRPLQQKPGVIRPVERIR